ncbi:MAG: Na(+)-translocating NADH-quinone reductase subunit A [Bacteroidales bacterium]|nr:Na(+)-translocating NADH-quinone reductase subunit A [Bacteroidales bacterium]
MLKIKRGLDIKMDGGARKTIVDATFVERCAVMPPDYVGLTPRLLVAEGDRVECGQPLLADKADPRVLYTSPVGGTVSAVVRGEKRALLAVEVLRDPAMQQWAPVDTTAPLREMMLQTGLWTLLRRRPFGTVPSPDGKPKSIFVSCFDSAPLAPDYDFVLRERHDELAAGFRAVASLAEGVTHICLHPGQELEAVANSVAVKGSRVAVHLVEGPHPAGNVGTQIALIDPINKGEEVWTIGVQEVALIGRTLLTGRYCPERVVALTGPAAVHPQYYKMHAGAALADILSGQIASEAYPALECDRTAVRVISGNVLTGTNAGADGYLGAPHSQITLLPEGDYYDFMGWLMPGLRKFSFSRTFLSGFARLCPPLQALMPVDYDTNRHGDVRPLVFSGNFERVCPIDIYPTQLIKACVVGDIELMEKLGIYEVEPEDLALCEVIDPSKTEIQTIIRQGLEKLRKEAL